MTKKDRGIFEKVKGSGAWYIRYADASGKIRKEKAGTVAIAKKLLLKRKSESQVDRKLPSLNRRRPKFSELADDMLDYSRVHNSSHHDNQIRMDKVLPQFGERYIDSLTPQEIERWLAGHTKTPATFNRYRAMLSLTFKIALHNRKCESNPIHFIKQRRENNANLRYMTPEEENKLRAYVEEQWPHHWCAVELALHTGMRQGEQFALKWSDVDLERRHITLQRTKNGRPRHIPLNDSAISALLAAQKQSNKQPWVFLNCYGERHTTPRVWFDKAREELKLKGITWHTLRHTFASRLAMAGVPILTIQELMGHRTIQMTLRYAHLSPEHNLAAVQSLCDTHKGTDPRTDPVSKVVIPAVPSSIN
jgi:integrase